MRLLLNWQTKVLVLTLSSFILVLLYTASTLSISYKEALIFFESKSILYYLTNLFTYFLGQNNIALRLPFLLFYIASVILMYKMTKEYFKNETDRLISILIFMFLPGVLGASLLVNNSMIVIFCVILYFYKYKLTQQHNYYLLAIFLFIDNSFAILYLTIFFYALQKKESKLLVVSLLFFVMSMLFYGFDVDFLEENESHVFDLFAIYASIFSPMLFLYFVYAMYRVGLKEEKKLFWYTSATALSFSFLLSFKQKIYIEDFAPYVIISIPLMMRLFFHSLRVRLPQFRTKYYFIAIVTLLFFVVNVTVILFNKPLYFFFDNNEKHFAYDYHFASEIATILKRNNITSVMNEDKKLITRLKFYGINEDRTNYISLEPLNVYDKKFDIKYLNKTIASLYYLNLEHKTPQNEP